MGEKKGGWGWLKWGCVGCLAAIILLLLIVATFIGLAKREADRIEPQSQVVTPELPVPEAPPELPPPPTAKAPASAPAATAEVGRVVLDLSGAQFRIQPANPGEKLRVEATYDQKSYSLEESLETEAGGPWTYRVSFRKTGSSFLTSLAELLGGTRPEVTIYLPREMPLELQADLRQGGVEVQLGGLWLTSAQIEFAQGGFLVEVAEPLQAPMDRLRIRGQMGGFAARRLGNASPRVLDVGMQMGGLDLDLRGAWRNDAEITLKTSMGGASLHLPPDVRVEGIESLRRDPPADPEVPRVTLRFTPETTLQNLEVH